MKVLERSNWEMRAAHHVSIEGCVVLTHSLLVNKELRRPMILVILLSKVTLE